METQKLPFYKYCHLKITILSHIQRRIGVTDGREQKNSGKDGEREERKQGEKREGKENRIGEGPLNGCTTWQSENSPITPTIQRYWTWHSYLFMIILRRSR